MSSGSELAKVLWYYNLIPTTDEAVQKIVCPFHEDVNPSMLINLQEGRYYCFGCGKNGDARKFVSEMEWKYHRLNDLESALRYKQILRTKKVSDIKISNRVKSFTRGPKKALYDEAYDYYHGLIKIDWQAPSGFQEVSDSLAYMNKRGYSAETLNKVKAKVTFNNNYGLIFPMFDNGIFKGWVCRTMVKEIEAKRKYLYNEGFSRSTTLCGDYGSKDYVIVVEGFMDRLRFIEAGIEPDNVVAILGWKMSNEQQNKLKAKGIKYIISALDNDVAGKKGTAYLKTTGFKIVRFNYLKGIKDPGEMNQEQFNKCYRRTMENFNKLLETTRKENQNGSVG